MTTRTILTSLIYLLLFSSCKVNTLWYHSESGYEKFEFSNFKINASEQDQFIYTHVKNNDKLVTIGSYVLCDDNTLYLYFDSTIQKTHLLPIDRGQFILTKSSDAEESLVSKISVLDKYSKQALSFINIEGYHKRKKVLSSQPIDEGHLYLNPPLQIDSLSIFYLNKTIPSQLSIKESGVYEVIAHINSNPKSNYYPPDYPKGVKVQMIARTENGKIVSLIAPFYKNREYLQKKN